MRIDSIAYRPGADGRPGPSPQGAFADVDWGLPDGLAPPHAVLAAHVVGFCGDRYAHLLGEITRIMIREDQWMTPSEVAELEVRLAVWLREWLEREGPAPVASVDRPDTVFSFWELLQLHKFLYACWARGLGLYHRPPMAGEDAADG